MTLKSPDDKVPPLPKVAACLKVTKQSIYPLARSRGILALKLGNVWRFRETDIDALIHTRPANLEGIAR